MFFYVYMLNETYYIILVDYSSEKYYNNVVKKNMEELIYDTRTVEYDE